MRMFATSIWVLFLLPAAGLAMAQQAAPKAPAEERANAESASVEGTVIDEASKAPLAEVEIRVGGRSRSAQTDAEGHYAVKDLPAGNYTVFPVKEGYGTGPAARSKRIRLAPGQHLSGVDFRLRKEAVLAGRVTDENKEPLRGVAVGAWVRSYRDGKPMFMPQGFGRTNDLGEFRVSGLKEETYYLGAMADRLSPRKRIRRAAGSRSVFARESAFYPGVPTFEGATPILLRAGEEREGLDLVLRKRKTYCIAASIPEGVIGAGATGASAWLWEVIPGWNGIVGHGAVSPGDEIEFCGVPPGSYTFEASTGDAGGGTVSYTKVAVSVGDKNVEMGRLVPMPKQQLVGEVTVDGARPKDAFPEGILVVAEPRDRGLRMGEHPEAAVQPPGRFLFDRIFQDEYWLRVLRLPDGFYVKEARQGSRSLKHEPFQVGAGEVRIVLAADGPLVSGTVVDDDGKPMSDVAVILAQPWLPASASMGLVQVQSDQDGQFKFSRIAPGEYRILALTDVSDNDVGNPELFRAHLTKATELDLPSRGTKTVTIKAVSSR